MATNCTEITALEIPGIQAAKTKESYVKGGRRRGGFRFDQTRSSHFSERVLIWSKFEFRYTGCHAGCGEYVRHEPES